jgi:hypothetical protein
MKFKIGDKIKVTDKHQFYGETGTIVSFYQKMYDVKMDNENLNNIRGVNSDCYFDDDNIQLFQIRNTKLARKIYPNHKVIDEEWLEI